MNPIVKQVIELWDARLAEDRANGAKRAVGDFEDRSGFDRQVFSRWRRGQNSAHIDSVEAVANALGYQLVLEKIEPSEAA